MAIISNEIDERGHVFENQYIRVDKVSVTKNTMDIQVGVYQDPDAFPHRVHTLQGEFDLYSDLNVWQQAYVYVKQRWSEHQDA